MATNQIRRTGADPAAKADSKSGYTVDPGPYEAVVISHVQGSRMGQLQVYIPDWGGLKTDPSNQIVVSYASPFYGKTFGTDQQNASIGGPNAQYLSGQSYGMWMVPPDVGNRVLVTFAAGDRSRGYWFACIYDSPSHHMVPAMGRNVGGDLSSGKTLPPNPPDQLSSALTTTTVAPVVEGYSGDPTTYNSDGITSNPRYVHEYQMSVLLNQGLDQDKVRGAISSSSLREAPSNVYGISTPGRSLTGDTPQTSTAQGDNVTQAVIARKGGHTFVMDDGDPNNKNDKGQNIDQLMRLRTTNGHQILMNDSENVLYIASASGDQWLEFSADGSINMFGMKGFNVRSKGALNFHSDSAVNINSGGSVSIHGEMGVSIDSLLSVGISSVGKVSVSTDGILSLSALGKASLSSLGAMSVSSTGVTSIFGSILNLNTGAPGIPMPVTPKSLLNVPDVTYGGQSWVYNPGALQSICTVVPAHEPWIDPSTGDRPAAAAGGGLLGSAVGAVGGAAVSAGAKIL